MTTYSSRDEISEQYRWDLTSIFENNEAFLSDLKRPKTIPDNASRFRDAFLNHPKLCLSICASMTK